MGCSVTKRYSTLHCENTQWTFDVTEGRLLIGYRLSLSFSPPIGECMCQLVHNNVYLMQQQQRRRRRRSLRAPLKQSYTPKTSTHDPLCDGLQRRPFKKKECFPMYSSAVTAACNESGYFSDRLYLESAARYAPSSDGGTDLLTGCASTARGVDSPIIRPLLIYRRRDCGAKGQPCWAVHRGAGGQQAAECGWAIISAQEALVESLEGKEDFYVSISLLHL